MTLLEKTKAYQDFIEYTMRPKFNLAESADRKEFEKLENLAQALLIAVEALEKARGLADGKCKDHKYCMCLKEEIDQALTFINHLSDE